MLFLFTDTSSMPNLSSFKRSLTFNIKEFKYKRSRKSDKGQNAFIIYELIYMYTEGWHCFMSF